METTGVKAKLWTGNYISLCIATFLISYSFFLLVPTLPFYLTETFGIGSGTVGAVLACYILAVLCVRPFAGFVADLFPRKRVYNIAYVLYALSFAGYLFVGGWLWLFIALRIFHGFAFGALNTTGNTLVIDIMPSSRRGEGLGYFGVMNNMAMAFGPMTGLFIISSCSYTVLFALSLFSSVLGLLFAFIVKAPKRSLQAREGKLLSLDRFFMVDGIPACTSLFLFAIPYGMTSSYMAVYAGSVGITSGAGMFFTVQAVGLIVSRLISGKQVDKGMITRTISVGMAIAVVGIACEAALAFVCSLNMAAGLVLYYFSALLIGYGFGTMFPAFNTLFVNLAPNSRRATANATYLTGWDVGVAVGTLLGGAFGNNGFHLSFSVAFLLVVASLLFFCRLVSRHFMAHRLR